jgi:hypothetical protein
MILIQSIHDMKNPENNKTALFPLLKAASPQTAAGLYHQTLYPPYSSKARIPPGGTWPVRAYNR